MSCVLVLIDFELEVLVVKAVKVLVFFAVIKLFLY